MVITRSNALLTIYLCELQMYNYIAESLTYIVFAFLCFSVPHANVYVLVNPVRLHLDYLTVLWANYFSLNLAQTLVCRT